MANPILADIGLPMVALYLPAAWFALIPIVIIESVYGFWRFELQFGRALFAQTIANCLSTIVGIPVTWLALVLVEYFTLPGGIGPAWLLPDPGKWSVAVSLFILTVVFYMMSVATEGFVVRRFFHELPRRTLRRWMIQANAISYAFLLILFIAASFTSELTQPVFEIMRPVTEPIVESAFWLISLVSPKNEKEKEPLLIEAVEAGDLKKATKLIASGANPNQPNGFGFPALSVAASRGDEKMTKLLLDARADVNARSVTLNDTALGRAAQSGNAATVRVLLAAGADVDARDGSGWTPLFNASMMGNLEIVEALLASGADVNARSATGWTALKEAQMRKQEIIAERLRRSGAIDFTDGTR
ncbi:MAG: ankyrin repeat domain-containing protein [Chthoniobacterales bacterium]